MIEAHYDVHQHVHAQASAFLSSLHPHILSLPSRLLFELQGLSLPLQATALSARQTPSCRCFLPLSEGDPCLIPAQALPQVMR